ncbi:forkhead box protein A2-B isoform X2 [Condylostylus longicornis]|uniref:forkhead box protein A2-B isoform X2 n=1 Tax=Condylostylus longicornis TaxID=2530218 RepID=UPI00244DC1C1|nr:forkhead box protein A2-B isoform X2 [Condylostylus longicornis]
MFEFEDMSTGFHDVFLSKYADSSGPILDLYISDSMQDMLDIDIRSEVATVVGGTNEFSSLVNDLPSLELDSNSHDGEASWLGGPKWSAPNDYYADVGACVNPNSVMPIITSSILNSQKCQINLNTNNYKQNLTSPPPSPKENKSHLTFSPNQIKVPSSAHDIIRKPSSLALPNELDSVKKDLRNLNGNESDGKSNTIKLAPGIGGLTFASNFAYTKLKQQNINSSNNTQIKLNSSQSITSLNTNNIKRDRETSSPLQSQNFNTITNGNYTTSNNQQQIHIQQSGKIISRNILVQSKNLSAINSNSNYVSSPVGSPQATNQVNNNTSTNKSSKSKQPVVVSEFPKPAYSYSCLIAMALKNSRSGSLPVSEIYSFMCEHFPYFKTAPNGWKNSVRHNLSLNKCFEKIEKPATNGGQRKGCLWAMNPSKITKMDEEVQKWSRKDPMAIRKAMVYPENLEALERGEMKHGSTGDSDVENDGQSDVDEGSDMEAENDIDDVLIETPESMEEEDDEQNQQHIQLHDRDFDIEVQDIYDAIDLEDDKESLHLTLRQNDLLEYTTNEYPSPKRTKVDVNYTVQNIDSIKTISSSPSSRNHQQIITTQQHLSVQHNRRKTQLINRVA